MEETRFEELVRKRAEVGLTHDEANELGRLFAEREGKPYSNADRRPGTASERAGDGTAGDDGTAGGDEAVLMSAEEPARGEVPPSH